MNSRSNATSYIDSHWPGWSANREFVLGAILLGSVVFQLITFLECYLEHGIKPDGFMPDNIYKGPPYSIDDSYLSFFSETKDNAFVPRALMVDFEPTVVDSIKGMSYLDCLKIYTHNGSCITWKRLAAIEIFLTKIP